MSSRKRWHLIFIMEANKICSFFGHRDIQETDQLYKATNAEILKAVDFGCRTFYFGSYGNFDHLCYKIVTKIKEEHPEFKINRIYCVNREAYLRKPTRYFNREDYDEIVFLMPSFNGWYKSIYFRNCAMIDQSDIILFYAENRANSGAYKAYQYAKRKNKKVINLVSIQESKKQDIQ